LHKDAEKKDGQVKELNVKLKKLEEQSHTDIERVKEEYEAKIQDIMSMLNEKEAAFKIMQQEFAVIKDFRRKRNDLMKELEDAKAELADTEKRHKDVVTRLEKKFFNEKIRLQNEANQKIGDLATQAHKEAVSNLKDTTKDVYKENIRMSEALLYHVQEGQELNRLNQELEAENRKLRHEAEMHGVIVKEKILHARNQELEIKQLKQSLQTMEHSLSHVVQEFEQERKIIGQVAQQELQQVKKVVEDLSKRLATKTVEIRHIKVSFLDVSD
jgi:DNA repair exonuclease SbcCD ATPase subunit